MKVVARWESKSGKHWVDLEVDEFGSYFYRSPNASGTIGTQSQAFALGYLEGKVVSGYFLPDSAKTPMRRVL